VKRYKIQGTWWAQDLLTYRQLLEVTEILKGQFKGFIGDEQHFGELLDRLTKEEVLPKLMRVLLQPRTRTRPGAWLNNWRLEKKGLTRENICEAMTAPQIAKVLLDFFILNVSWITT